MSTEQTGDVLLINNPGDNANAAEATSLGGVEFGIEILNGTVSMTQSFETAIWLSLFGGNQLDDGSLENDETWWGNLLETQPEFKMVSRTQNLLRSLPLVTGNLRLIEEAVIADLQWFITTGIASSIDNVKVSIPAVNRVQIDGSIVAFGEETSFSFTENWKSGLKTAGGLVAFEPVETVINKSLQLDGATEAISSPFNDDIGLDNRWSMMFWINPAIHDALTEQIIQLETQGSTNSEMTVSVGPDFFNPGDQRGVRVHLWDINNISFKDLIWLDRLPDLAWSQLIVTFDGDAVGDPLLVYIDRVDIGAPDQVNADIPGTMEDVAARRIDISNNNTYSGLMHQVAFWNVVLTPAEIAALGSARAILTEDFGAYVSGADCLHWYKFAEDETSIGRDYGNGELVTLSVHPNIDQTNIVEGGPT